MPVHTEMIKLTTKPYRFYDISDNVQKIVKESELLTGICLVFCPGSTSAVMLNENDPTLWKDMGKVLESIASERKVWQHAENAHSHIRAAMLGASITVPVVDSKAVLGQWQSVLFYEADVKPRQREIIVTIVGEFEE